MIAVDRLILEVPGISEERAERLARAIGAIAANAGPASAERLEIAVEPNASDASILAAFATALRTGAL